MSFATVLRICITWIKFLNQQLRPLITWPSQELIDAHMPAQFIEFCSTTRVILHCTEFFTEVPSCMSVQSLTYFVKNHQQLSKKNVVFTRKIASLRIHVERAIGRVKQYRILSNVVPLSLVHSIDSIWGICCALTLPLSPILLSYQKKKLVKYCLCIAREWCCF